MLSPTDIDLRVPAWIALSELFLDVRLIDEDYSRIRSQLATTGFTSAALSAILRQEVAPILGYNLFSFSGEWVGWSEADLRRLLVPRLQRESARDFGGWFICMVLRGYLAREWCKVDPRRSTGADPPAR